MAVYEHRYRAWTGPRTPDVTRFLVIPKYAFQQVFAVRPFTFFFAMCFLPLAFALATIYALHNLEPLAEMGLDFAQAGIDLEFGAERFDTLLTAQGWFACFLAVFVGPGLISRDLVNNGLPLYLARPISRAEYVLGKATVLAALMSAITWLPMLVLFGVQANLAPAGWTAANLRIPLAIVIGAGLWITVLVLLTLAVSAWVRWRPVAALLLLVIFFAGKLLGAMVDALFRSELGQIFNLGRMIRITWAHLFGLEAIPEGPPLFAALFVLGLVAAASLLMLHLKVRAYEVIR